MAFTKVVGPGIHTLSNILSHNINSSGIITATKFVGPFDGITIGGGTTISSDGINVTGIVTATGLDINGNGDISGNLVVGGNLTANGDFTTLNTTLREVELLRVDAQDNIVAAGIITQRGSGDILNLYDGSNKEFSVADGGTVKISQSMAFQQSDRTTTAGLLGRGSLLLAGTQQTDFAIRSAPHSSNLVLGVGVTERLRITSAGTVGINTATPIGDFTILTDGMGYLGVDGGGGKGAEINIYHKDTKANTFKLANNGGSNELAQYALTNAGGKHIWHIGGTTAEKMRLTTTGLGIGTDNPGQALEVYGTGTSTVVEVNGTGRYRGFEIHESGTRKAYFFHDATENEAILNTAEGTLQFAIGDTPVMRINSSGDLVFKDGVGQGNSLSSKIIVTDSSNNVQYEIGMLSTGNEDLYFSNSRNSNIRFRTNGSTRWKIDGNPGHLLPETAGAVDIGSSSAEIGNIFIADSKKVFLGSDQDTEIYHNGSHSYLTNTTGNIFISNVGYTYIDQNHFRVRNAAGNHMIDANNSGTHQGVGLFYTPGSAGTEKLRTSATGITVTGEVAASQDFPVTKPVIDFNFAAEKKLDPRFTFYRRGTASYVDKKGIVRYATSNEPRFDHHPTTGASLGFLVEKQQNNYQAYSVDMDAGADYKNAVTVVNDAAISPDGTKNASKIIGSDNQSTSQRLGWSTQVVNNSSYTMWSIWLKSEETSCIIQIYSNTYTFGADYLNVELADGTVGGPHTANDANFRYNLEKYPNKWWRLSWGGNGQGGAGGMYVAIVPAMNSTRGANTGSAHSKVWYAWGVQEEVSTESRIATSYIPTYGATATRYGDYAQIDGKDFDDFFDRFQGTIINEHSNALQSYGGGGSGWEFNNDQFQTNLITQTGSGYAANSYPGAQASIMGDRGSNGSGSGSGSDYFQVYGPNDADAQNAPANTGNGRYPSDNIPDYTRYYRTYIDAMTYDITPSTNVMRVASGGATTSGTNTQNISLHNISKLELGNGASDLGYSNIYGRIKRWVYYDKVVTQNQLGNLTAQLPQSYL